MSATAATPRRVPLQARSQDTVQKLLAAAVALLARGQPVDLLTTAQIAAEARISVGALYRFFPDKQAIVDAIALKHMEVFQEALALRLMFAPPPDPPAFLGAVIDAFADYLSANPDFRTLAFGAPGGGHYVSRRTRESYAGSGEVSQLVRAFLTEAFGITMTEDFDRRLRLAIEIGDRLLAYAFEQPAGTARDAVLAETRRILAATLFPQTEQ